MYDLEKEAYDLGDKETYNPKHTTLRRRTYETSWRSEHKILRKMKRVATLGSMTVAVGRKMHTRWQEEISSAPNQPRRKTLP